MPGALFPAPRGIAAGGMRVLALLFPLSLGTLPLSAQTALRVERVGPARVSADPGARLTAVFRVVRPPDSARIDTDARLPAGWDALMAAQAGDDAAPVRLVPVAVPRDAAPGAYVVRLAARAGGASSADSVVVTVRERREVTVSLAGAPRFAAAGTAYALEFLVANRGNAPARVHLAAEAPRGFSARPDSPSVVLAPNASRSVRVAVSTPERLERQAVSLVTLRAAVDGESASEAAESRVEVVPRGGSAAGREGHRLPVRVTLRGSADGASPGGLPGELTASGALTPGGSTRVDVVLRGAGAAEEALGERDQRSVALRGRGFEVLGGDQLWALSPLTEPGRFGYGAGGRIEAGPLVLRGFTQESRRTAGAPRISGLSAGLGGADGGLAAQYLRRGAGDSAALSLRGVVSPLRGLRLDAEAGRGIGAAAGAAGVSAQLFGSFRRLSLDARVLRADAGFPGDQGGRRLDHAYLEARPVGTLRLRGSFDREHRERLDTLALDPGLPDPVGPPPVAPAPRTESARAGVALGAVSVDARRERREGGEAGARYARESRSVVAAATARRRGASLGGGVEAGTVEDLLAEEESPFVRAWLRSGVTLPSGQLLWASVERRTGAGVESGAARERLSGTLHLSLSPAGGTRVGVMAQAYREDGGETESFVDATVEQRLAFGHALRVRTRAYPGAPEGRKARVLLDYVVPLGVPLSRGGGAGTVSGRVVDAETGRGVAGAIVRVGGRAVVTDGRGRWSVAGLPGGRHAVEVDPLTAGLGRVPLDPERLEVDVTRGARVEVRLARGARIAGTLALFAGSMARPGETARAGGVEGAVMEARSGAERRRRATDAQGRFEFGDLRPGRWTVTVAEAGLPPHHALERDSVEVDLPPGAAREVGFRVLPRRREVRIVAGGDLELNGAAAPAPAPPSAPPPARNPAPRVPSGPVAASGGAGNAGEGLSNPTREEPAVAADGLTIVIGGEPSPGAGERGFRDWPNDTYTVQPGDGGLEAVAWLAYRDGSLWPKLWLANRGRLESPHRLVPGTVLRVPAKAPLTPAEREAARGWERRR